MQDWIDKILTVINECKDPINDLTARNLRDDALHALSIEVKHMTRKEFEAHATNDDDHKSLSWYYTRFIHNKYLTSK